MTSGKNSSFNKIKKALKYALSFILAGIFLAIAFNNVDINEVLDIVSHASLFWIFIVLIAWFLSHFVRAVRWKVILHSIKPNASLKNLFGALMIGYGVNCVVPRLGEVTRAVMVGKWEGLSKSSMFGAVLLERIIDIIFLCFTVLIAFIMWNDDLVLKFPWLKSGLYITFIFIVLVTAFIILLIRFKEKLLNIIVKILGKISVKLADRAANILDLLIHGFASLKGTKNYIYTIFLSILIYVLYALNAYLAFFMIGMEKIQPVSFEMGWVLMSVSAVGIIIPTPGATGSYHALTKSALVLLFGFNEIISLSYAFLTHIINYILFIILGSISFLVLNKQHENLFKIVSKEVEEL